MSIHGAARTRARLSITTVFALVAAALVVPAVTGSLPTAAADTGTGTPVISLSRAVAPQTLFGTDVSVTLSAQHVSGANGYNLTFSDVLPAGATVSGGTAPSQQILQPDGTTLLTWLNESDLLVGTTSAISYSYSYPTSGAAPFAMGTTVSETAEAYVNSAPRTVPAFDATGAIIPATVTGSAPSTSSTQLVPYTVQKQLVGVPENEMLRGVHDHKYEYQITVTNNPITVTSAPVLTDYLPPTSSSSAAATSTTAPWSPRSTPGRDPSPTAPSPPRLTLPVAHRAASRRRRP
jgi:hypothetical protein